MELKRGDTGNDVRRLQILLANAGFGKVAKSYCLGTRTAGYLEVKVDGDFGDVTECAVRLANEKLFKRSAVVADGPLLEELKLLANIERPVSVAPPVVSTPAEVPPVRPGSKIPVWLWAAGLIVVAGVFLIPRGK